MKDKKAKIAIISVVALLLLLIGVTYAYWLVTKTQTNSNIISSACLDITLDNESNDINLISQYPMSDEDGMKLTPYTFTVTNNCNTSVEYQVALEALGEEATSIASSAIKVALDNKSNLYSNYGEVSATISGAYESRSIGFARLAARGNEGSSATHALRIWIDENAPISEANKTFQSKISVTVGYNIKAQYIEGTMAYDILKNNGGTNATKELDGTVIYERISDDYSVYVGNSYNYYYGTSYTIDETGKYQLSGEVVQAKLSECRDGTKTCGKYTTKSTATSSATLYEITNWNNPDYSADYYYVVGKIIRYTNTFDIFDANNETGLYKAQDDLGESYYFRGDVTNNYVQFGVYSSDLTVVIGYGTEWYNEDESFVFETMEDCANSSSFNKDCTEVTIAETGDPMYWRIVRINGDGTIRLVYDGTTKAENGTKHRSNIGDRLYGDPADQNYGESDAKGIVDSWYNTNLKTNYESYIADGIFCSDNEVIGRTYYDMDENPPVAVDEEDIEEPYYQYAINLTYASYNRLQGITKTPQLTCTRPEDRYTTKTALGNGRLTNPIGLLSGDEVVFAGAGESANKSYYLYSGYGFWTITPMEFNDWPGGTPSWFVDSNGQLNLESPDGGTGIVWFGEHGIRPVINLRADVEFTGDGSFENPYVIKTN